MIVAILLSVQLPLASAVKRLDGSNISSVEIDAVVTRLMNAAEVTGTAITIFNGGKMRYQKTTGFATPSGSFP